MNYQAIFDNAKLLFEYFSWYSLLLVLGTTLVMIPLNILYKKIMKKDSLSRLRKSISSISVYLVSLGLIALFTGCIIKAPLTFEYLFTASMSCGILSMLLWAVIKFVRDYGFKPILKLIMQNKEARKWIKELGLSNKLINLVFDNIDNYLKDANVSTFEDYMKNETTVINQIKSQITGFVSSDKLNAVVKNMVELIRNKYKKENKQL